MLGTLLSTHSARPFCVLSDANCSPSKSDVSNAAHCLLGTTTSCERQARKRSASDFPFADRFPHLTLVQDQSTSRHFEAEYFESQQREISVTVARHR